MYIYIYMSLFEIIDNTKTDKNTGNLIEEWAFWLNNSTNKKHNRKTSHSLTFAPAITPSETVPKPNEATIKE